MGEAWRNEPEDGPFLRVYFSDIEGNGGFTPLTRLIGSYNASNVLAAVCIGQHFGVPDDTIATAIRTYEPTNNRSQFVDTGRNHVVMDAYNANPSSMAAALENFAALKSDRKKLAILGGMKELGEVSSEEHAALISLVQRLGLDAVYVGPEFAEHTTTNIRAFSDAQEAFKNLTDEPVANRLILVKGSRGTKLETLRPAL